jgi:cell division protein FtsB
MGEDLEEVFQIDDPEIDVTEIMREIRERIANRGEEGLLEDVDFPSFLRGDDSEVTSSEFFEQEMRFNLEQANLAYDKVWVGLHLVSRPVPLVGRIWLDVRRQFHQLVVFYVNMLAGKQVAVNEYLVRTLNHLVRGFTSLAEEKEIRKLQDRVAELEGRVRELEAAADRGEGRGNDQQ